MRDTSITLKSALDPYLIYYIYILLAEICMVDLLHLNILLILEHTLQWIHNECLKIAYPKKQQQNIFHFHLMLSSLASIQHMDCFNYLQFSEMQMQGHPPHYTNGISNNSETKWRCRFKIQRSDTDVRLVKKHSPWNKALEKSRAHVITGVGSTSGV